MVLSRNMNIHISLASVYFSNGRGQLGKWSPWLERGSLTFPSDDLPSSPTVSEDIEML